MKIVTHRQPHPNQPKLLVFINNDALGDSIMKLPFLDSVRKRYPAHHITLLSNQHSPFAGSLAALCVARVDQVISEINFEYSLKVA